MLAYERKQQGRGFFGPSRKDNREIKAFDALIAQQRDKNIAYVFWTGGFDSSYGVLRLLLDEKRIVQPLYLKGAVDSGIFQGLHRANRTYEKKARDQIEAQIKQQYSARASDLLPVQEFDYMPKDKAIVNAVQHLKLFPARFNQYEAMARFAKFYRIQVHVGVIGIEGEKGAPLPTDAWGTHLRSALQRPQNVLHTSYVTIADQKHPMSNLIFPTAFSSKRRALAGATQKGYDNILRLTWSCWYPINGKACKTCDMCRHRVLPHPGDTNTKPSADALLRAFLRNHRQIIKK